MRVIAIYNMKGGVGKTTAAVNLSYYSAAAGRRTLLWDLDPQGAASFAFRIRPHVDEVGKKSLTTGEAFAAAIKETDYGNLDLLPADFAYRKVDRLLGQLGQPERVVTDLIARVGRGYDTVFLDCPAGFTLLTEGIFAAADVVLVPTIPTVLSLRMVARLIKSADRCGSPCALAAFFSMVDRRKSLHRRACDWSARHPELFLPAQVPYASIVEQMAVRRMPLPEFAPRDASTQAFVEIWRQVSALSQRRSTGLRQPDDGWRRRRHIVENLILELDPAAAPERPSAPAESTQESSGNGGDGWQVVHRFDTDQRDLERCGYVLELREQAGRFTVIVERSGVSGEASTPTPSQARIDKWWAMQILSGAMSPAAALEQRLGKPFPQLVKPQAFKSSDLELRRIDSRVG